MRAGALPLTDPVWVGADGGADFINQGMHFMINRALRRPRRSSVDLFPELRDRWHVKLSVDIADLDLPSEWMAIDEVYSYDNNSATEPDEHLAKRRKIDFIDENYFETAARSDAPSGYPTACVRMGSKLYVHPTPGTGYDTWLLVKGLKYPPGLLAADATPILRDHWESAIEDAAAYLLFKRLQWDAEAAGALAALDANISGVVPPTVFERAKRSIRVRVKGLPHG